MVKDIFSGVSKISFDCHLELLHYNYNNDINTHVSNGPTSMVPTIPICSIPRTGVLVFIVQYQWVSKMFTNTDSKLNVKKQILFQLSPKDGSKYIALCTNQN